MKDINLERTKASEVSTSGNIIKERFINTFEQLAHFVCDNICIIVSFIQRFSCFIYFGTVEFNLVYC